MAHLPDDLSPPFSDDENDDAFGSGASAFDEEDAEFTDEADNTPPDHILRGLSLHEQLGLSAAEWAAIQQEAAELSAAHISPGLAETPTSTDVPTAPTVTELAGLAVLFRAVTDAASLAQALNAALPLYTRQHPKRKLKPVSGGLLLFFAHHKKERYQVFSVPKRTAGQFREIKAPAQGLRRVQRLLLLCLTAAFTTCHEAAHGFVPGRSILTNAQPHASRRFVLNLDLRDFFPSTSVGRVLAVLQLAPFHLPKEAAHLIANLCCDGGSLPQGAPTSPLLTNVVCQRLDRKLSQLAVRYRCRYTRYADDLTFSSQRPAFTPAFHAALTALLTAEGYQQHPAKQRLQTPDMRQEVTGVVVNERPNVPREYVRDIRFLLHVWQKHGYTAAAVALAKTYPESKAHARYKGNKPKLEKVLAGKIAYLGMVRGKEDVMYINFAESLRQNTVRKKFKDRLNAA